MNFIFSCLKTYRYRILGSLAFVIFLVATWFIFYQQPNEKEQEEVHISLQEQLREIIRDTLVKKNPFVKNLEFQKMWTKNTGKRGGQIRAVFTYSFEDEEQVKTKIKGWALINKQSPNTWSMDHVEIDHTQVVFENPITIFSTARRKTSLEKKEILDIEKSTKQTQ